MTTSERRRILQLCAVDFTLFHFLVPLVRGLEAAGHEVVAACADGPHAEALRAEGMRVEAIPFSRRLGNLVGHVRAYGALRRLLARERFDIVHVHTPVAALIGRLAAWRSGVPCIIYTAHGFYFHDRMVWWKRWPFIGLEWLGGCLTDILFTQSEEDAETARRLDLCRTGTVYAIGNGVDPARFSPGTGKSRAATRQALDTPENACVIAVVGRLVAEKGYPELFRAMRSVDGVLWVIGARLESDHAQSIDAALAEIDNDPALKGCVRLLGQRADVPDLLRAADIFVLPSHREGMPRSIIEAMMTGLPVVATDIRGSREEVVDGETGLLVSVEDETALAAALNRLVGDPDTRRRMGQVGRARARDLYDESKIVAGQLAMIGLTKT